jgi:regulator of protease activity HflC (stomatin/prohibitin superfamily)
MLGFKIINQYELGIVFRWGRALPGVRGPGLAWVNPFTDRLRKVNMQIMAAAVPGQETITRDNVTMRVDAVIYYRVVDPLKAVINVQDYRYAMSQVAQTSLRSVIGGSNMDQLLSERDEINAQLKEIIDAPTEGPWGVRVERVELKDISLPESMKRSMSRQAEAERERRARIIAADGEYQAAGKLAQAATVMSADPGALQLRLLQAVVEVAAEKNSTLMLPFPVEMLRFFERVPERGGQPGPGPVTQAQRPTATRPCRDPSMAPVRPPPSAPRSRHQRRNGNSSGPCPGAGRPASGYWSCSRWTRPGRSSRTARYRGPVTPAGTPRRGDRLRVSRSSSAAGPEPAGSRTRRRRRSGFPPAAGWSGRPRPASVPRPRWPGRLAAGPPAG